MTRHDVAQTLFRNRMGALRLGAAGLLLAVSGSVFSAHGQEPSPLERVEALGLDTAKIGRVTVYFAPADRDRAVELAALAEAAAAFFERELGISFSFGVAALAPEHWFSEFPGVPYAIPWVSVTERLLFVASSLSEGFMVRGPTPLHDRRRIDKGLLHEYGHLLEQAHFRPGNEPNTPRVPWFWELLANAFAYAYISSSDPEWAAEGKAMWRDVVEGYTPAVVSLDWGFMNDLPPNELARTYAWYQNLLNLRAAALHEAHGLDFIRSLKERLAWAEAADWTTASLLESLEEIAPSFKGWADDLRNPANLPRDDSAPDPIALTDVTGESPGAAYLRAMALLTGRDPSPSFLKDGERFWFIAGSEASAYAALVHPRSGSVAPLVDSERVRSSLAKLGVEPQGRGLPFEEVEWLDGAEDRVSFVIDDRRYVLDRASHMVTVASDSLVAAIARRTPRPLRPGMFRYSPPIEELPGPAAGDNTPLVSRLEGTLLMIYGTHDTHIPFAEWMRMTDALIHAGKQFDVVVMPGENHVSVFGPYWYRTVSGYFQEHLR